MSSLSVTLMLLHRCPYCAWLFEGRCLVNALNARDFCTRLEAELAAGRQTAECRGLVKAKLRSLDLKACLKDAVQYLPGRRRQVWSCANQAPIGRLIGRGREAIVGGGAVARGYDIVFTNEGMQAGGVK